MYTNIRHVSNYITNITDQKMHTLISPSDFSLLAVYKQLIVVIVLIKIIMTY